MWWKTFTGSVPRLIAESAPCSMVVSRAAPRPLPETSADENGGAPLAGVKDIEVISADGMTGPMEAGDGKVRQVAQPLRKQRLLNLTGDFEFLSRRCRSRSRSTSRALSRMLAACAPSAVQNLAVQIGEGRRPPGVEIDGAQQLPLVQPRRTRPSWLAAWRRAE